MEMWLLPVAIFHLVMVLAAYLFVRRQGDSIQAATEALVVFLMPVAGFVLVLGTRLLKGIKSFQCNIDPHKLMNRNDVFTNMISYDENVIPLHDTYLVDDVKAKRKVFLDAVKQNVLQNPRVLKMATYDQDREISYYAVSMISGHIEELENKISQIEGELLENTDDTELQQEYAALLKDYLTQEFVDKITKRNRTEQYVSLLDRLLQKSPNDMGYMQEKIDKEIALGNYVQAQETCERLQQAFPDHEEPYLAYINLYFYMRQSAKMQEKLAELKSIPRELSLKALNVIRYWGGTSHE